jgi:hypothetical protein
VLKLEEPAPVDVLNLRQNPPLFDAVSFGLVEQPPDLRMREQVWIMTEERVEGTFPQGAMRPQKPDTQKP